MSDLEPLSLVKLDKVNQRTKDLISGSIRNFQLLLPTTSAYYNIPISINYIILAFYYQYEQFGKCGAKIKLSDDCMTIKHLLSQGWYNAYGIMEIKSLSGVCCYWKIKCVKKTNNMFIGISTHRDTFSAFQYKYDKLFYALFNSGSGMSAELRTANGSTEIAKQYGVRYGEGDVVRMDLNLKKKNLSFDVNEEKCGVAFEDIRCDENTTYYLAISIVGAHHEMSIVDFGYY